MHRRALRHLRHADPVLARVIARVGPCRFRAASDLAPFGYVVRAIVYQQLSGSAAATIHRRLLDLFEGEPPGPDALMRTEDAALRGAGLSRRKIEYMKDLASRVSAGHVPIDSLHELDDEAVIAALTQVKGIGRWTAQMFLMFRLGRLDVLPELDLGVRKAIQRAYRTRGLPTTARVLKIGAPWAPYRTIASWYLWRSLEADGTQP